MRWYWAILLTLGLFVASLQVPGTIGDIATLLLVLGTAAWAAYDSRIVGLKEYRSGIAYGPVAVFFGIVLLWVICFPWYLTVRGHIKRGVAVRKDAVESEPGHDRLKRALLPVGRSGWAIASGYLGLVSVLLVPAPLALITGILAVKDIRGHPGRHGMGRAVFGIVMGLLGTLLLLVVIRGVVSSRPDRETTHGIADSSEEASWSGATGAIGGSGPGRAAEDLFPVRAWEPELQAGEAFRDCLECPVMVVIPAGNFTMGSPAEEEGRKDNEGPQQPVKLARSFAMGKYEVTKSQFAAFVQAAGHDPTRCRIWLATEWKWLASTSWRRPGFSQTESDPVVCVSWDDAKKYVEWLSGKAGKAYRLPSESEWEYAARGGTATARYWRDDPDTACSYANVADQTAKKRFADLVIYECDDGYLFTAPVGKFESNRFGLHDVLGNVLEWVEDCWNGSYAGAPADGSPWTTGECGRRVVRGGSFDLDPSHLRSAARGWIDTSNRHDMLGFRVARSLPSGGS